MKEEKIHLLLLLWHGILLLTTSHLQRLHGKSALPDVHEFPVRPPWLGPGNLEVHKIASQRLSQLNIPEEFLSLSVELYEPIKVLEWRESVRHQQTLIHISGFLDIGHSREG